MLSIIQNIPDLNTNPLSYVFEHMKLQHKPDTLWLEFGTYSGNTINYISKFTNDKVYGFDSFEGLPEKWRDGYDKGCFNKNGNLPEVNSNVELIKGWFNETVLNFIQTHNKKVSFIHMDADLYSSTKYVLDTLKDYIDTDCIIVFDELVNYPGFDGDTGELKAFYEFITENKVDYEWIGMNGTPTGMTDHHHEIVAVVIHSINRVSSYRLGDLVFLEECMTKDEINEILVEHPNSIGSKYFLKKNNSSSSNINIITEIVLEEIEKNLEFLPKDISNSTVIHLRLGDVIAGNAWHEKLKRPLKIDYIKSLLENNSDKNYVIGKCFFAKTSSTNYEECVNLSNEYLHNVINELSAEYFNSDNADVDLCCAVKSKLFIQGRGYFSLLIAEIRKKLNLPVIETTPHDNLV